MALPNKRIPTFDGAIVALWRIAESGDVEELPLVMRRATNINAANEHGVTALMRAAQEGHVKMVRALLERGADANLKRNDQFTALALAAFFGHVEVVRVLMEHGADSQASTRNGTSPQMWAAARTFSEVADQLDKPVMRPKPVARANPVEVANKQATPAVTPPAVTTRPLVRPAAVVIRTLKDPPEIWDLVHEAPRHFDARSAFLARLQSMKSGLAFRAAAAAVLLAMCVVGVMVLRGVQARSERTVEPQPNVTSQPNDVPQPAPPLIAPVTESHPASQTASAPPQIATPPDNDNIKPSAANKPGARLRVVSSNRRDREAKRVEANEVIQPAISSERAEPPARVEKTTKPPASVPLSPQLISPGKSSATKGKVIQWP